MSKISPCFCPPFTPMSFLEPGKSGNFELDHFTMTEAQCKHARLSSIFGGEALEHRYTEPGTYARLYDKGRKEIVMTDTGMERYTNLEVVRKATGKVLIAGLGMGMILLPIAAKREVEYIRVVELEEDVIHLIWPQICKKLGVLAGKIQVVQESILEYEPMKSEPWDIVYFDIWNSITADNYPVMKTLHRRFSHFVNRMNPGMFMESWRRDKCKAEYLEEMRWS